MTGMSALEAPAIRPTIEDIFTMSSTTLNNPKPTCQNGYLKVKDAVGVDCTFV